jgi:septum site-determining protein MinD
LKKLFLIIGAPGSGKTTDAQMIAQRHPNIIAHYSTGDLLREEVASGSKLGEKINSFVSQGVLCPLNIVIDTVIKAIKSSKKDIILLDGFPRSEEQMITLDQILSQENNIELKAVIEVVVSEDTAKNRVLGRARGDDDKIEVFENRMKVFHEPLPAIENFYFSKKLLFKISGEGTIDEVVNAMDELIKAKVNGKVITITSGKGGVGKSTISANLAIALSDKGYKVAVADFDIGLRNLDMILGLESRICFNIIDVMENKATLNQAIIQDKKSKNCYFLPASQTQDKTILDKEKVTRLVEELQANYDYVIIDSPAGIESGFEHAIIKADIALIIVNLEISSVHDADRVIGIIDAKSFKTQDGSEVEKYLVLNRVKMDLVEKGDMLSMEDVENILSLPTIGVIPEDEELVKSTNQGDPIVRHKHTLVAQAIEKMAENITKATDPDDFEFVNFQVKENKFILMLKRFFR